MSKIAIYVLSAISIVSTVYFTFMHFDVYEHQISLWPSASNQSSIHFNFDNISYESIDAAMTQQAKQLFMSTILNKKSYIEWGSGGSTKLAPYLIHSQSNHIFSIEHVQEWCLKMQQQNNLSIALNKLHYFCVDVKLPRFRQFGFPPINSSREQIETFSDIYVNQIDAISKEFHVNTFDIVFIDGRFRTACALKVLFSQYLNRKSIVMIHDYSSTMAGIKWRNYSFYVEDYYKIIKCADVLCLFKPMESYFKFDDDYGADLGVILKEKMLDFY